MAEIFIPNVLFNKDGQDRQAGLLTYDFEYGRTIYLVGEVNDMAALSINSQLRYLNSKSGEDIIMCINSGGGAVHAGLSIYDCMNEIECDVITVATGMAASMGAFLLAAGTKGKRYATENAEIMIHQPIGGVQGQATDISLVADHIQYLKSSLAKIIAKSCDKNVKTLLRDMERDYWMSSIEAKKYGLIDNIGYPGGRYE